MVPLMIINATGIVIEEFKQEPPIRWESGGGTSIKRFCWNTLIRTLRRIMDNVRDGLNLAVVIATVLLQWMGLILSDLRGLTIRAFKD